MWGKIFDVEGGIDGILENGDDCHRCDWSSGNSEESIVSVPKNLKIVSQSVNLTEICVNFLGEGSFSNSQLIKLEIRYN